jgi:predicted DNA-binding transcriptional regulator AlpA
MARREVTGRKPGVSNHLIKQSLPDPEDDEPNPPPRLAMSIPEFCVAVGISEDFFYKLKRQGQTPRLMKIGARTMVSVQAASDWLIEREGEAASPAEVESTPQ